MKYSKNKPTTIIFIYFLIFSIFTFVFLILFHTPLFQSQTVLFYRGLILSFATLVICVILSLLFSIKKKPYFESIFAALIISFSFHLCFFVIFPVRFDHSITMFLLDNINQSHREKSFCPGLTKKELNKMLIDDYIIKNKTLDKRIEEQKATNYLQEKNQCIILTPQAKTFLSFSEIIKKVYNIK